MPRLSVLALEQWHFIDFSTMTSSFLKDKMYETRKKKYLHSEAQRGLVSALNGAVISGVNGVGMLLVTGYNCARPRGNNMRARFAQ